MSFLGKTLPFLGLFLVFAGSIAMANDLVITDKTEGTGAEAVPGSEVTVHYTGWLTDGTKFDSSLDRGQPFNFTIGEQQVIPGWEKGVVGMRVGGSRELVIPPELGYGGRGAGGVIPPNATLRFEIELLDVSAPKFTNIDNEEAARLIAEGATIVDIRRVEEWRQTGVVEGSKLLTFFDDKGRVNPTFMEEFTALVDKDQPVVLICRTGNRTLAVSRFLSERVGYTKVYNVEKGITAWQREGRPTASCDC